MLSEKIIKTIHEEFPELQNLVSSGIEAEAQKIRDSIPSGFVELGELDYDYMLNNENVVKLKTKSIAYVNGYRVEIPANTVVDIGKAPEKEAREDLLFLEVWKDEDFNRDGKLKWRIRHCEDVDFSYFLEGFHISGTVWRGTEVCGQGGNEQPTHASSKDLIRMFCTVGSGSTDDGFRNISFKDIGLYMCGDGTNSSREILKTLDGYCYAIPMFRLYRKPSCGKAIPFEYQKINPKVDYTKFANLMKEEKVERVVSEVVGGRSLVNLVRNESFFGNITINALAGIYTQKFFNDKSYQISKGTKYTFIFDYKINSITKGSEPNIYVEFQLLKTDGQFAYKRLVANIHNKSSENARVAFTIDTENYSGVTNGLNMVVWDCNISMNISNLCILEGDWTNKEIPEYFTGLKSLGEDEGNLIEVKTGILNESSYDPSTGNVKLNTVSGANYITSDNLIMPNIEAQVKRGESKLSDLTSFGKVDNLVGDEKVEFSKIKGRTLQNLIEYKDIVCGAGQTQSVAFKPQLKPNTLYTVIVHVTQNSMDGSVRLSGYNFGGGAGAKYDSESTFVMDKNIFGAKSIGYWVGKTKVTTFGSSTPRLSLFTDSATTGNFTATVMVLEGDYTNISPVSIPYFKGIKSVGEEEGNIIKLLSRNKNMVDLPKEFIWDSSTQNKGGHFGVELVKIPIEYGESYNVNYSYEKIGGNVAGGYGGIYSYLADDCLKDYSWFLHHTFTDKGVRYKALGTSETIKHTSNFNFKNSENYKYLIIGIGIANSKHTTFKVSDVYVSKASDNFDLVESKKYNKEITLREPLRSLPNGVCDTIEGNKVIRRVGKVVYDGSSSESWSINAGLSLTNTFAIMNRIYSKKAGTENFMSDRFFNKYAGCITTDEERCWSEPNTTAFYVRIAKSKLPSQDLNGFKTWLSQNPITVYYELTNPIEEPIEPNYDKESIKTYQLDAPLRSLPNGVKDEIVGDKLIRRCGEVWVNGSENWYIDQSGAFTPKTNTEVFSFKILDSKGNDSNFCVISNRMRTTKIAIMFTQDIEGIALGNLKDLYIRISKTNLDTNDVSGLKKYLSSNPMKVIYELATPIEIPLKEVHASTANFSLQRQFSSGNWLRELPNGVKDTVENGKVIRRVGKITLNGSESGWVLAGLTSKFAEYKPSNAVVDATRRFGIIGDKLPEVDIGANASKNPIGICSTGHGAIRVRPIDKDDLSVSEVTTWLSQNPLTILYELATPTEEALSTDNYMYYPHHEINTYCGSLYVGNGTNDVFVDNGLKNDGVIIDTPFRSIENKAVVEDCKYKKTIDGYSNSFMTGSKKNLLNVKDSRYFDTVLTNPPTYGVFISKDEDSAGVITLNSANSLIIGHATDGYKGCKIWVKLLPNTQYCLSFGLSGNTIQMLQNNGTSEIYVANGNNGVVVLTTDEQGIGNVRIETQSAGFTTLNNLQLEIGNVKTSYESFVSTQRFIENTESNDVDDLRHLVSLTGFNYDQILNESFDSLLRGEL